MDSIRLRAIVDAFQAEESPLCSQKNRCRVTSRVRIQWSQTHECGRPDGNHHPPQAFVRPAVSAHSRRDGRALFLAISPPTCQNRALSGRDQTLRQWSYARYGPTATTTGSSCTRAFCEHRPYSEELSLRGCGQSSLS